MNDDEKFELQVRTIALALDRWFGRKKRDRAACIGAMLSLVARECADAEDDEKALAKLAQTGKVMGTLFTQARIMNRETVH